MVDQVAWEEGAFGGPCRRLIIVLHHQVGAWCQMGSGLGEVRVLCGNRVGNSVDLWCSCLFRSSYNTCLAFSIFDHVVYVRVRTKSSYFRTSGTHAVMDCSLCLIIVNS